MATMKDIAREAGVSHGTVSNVLNKTGKVSIEKIRLVEEAAKRLGYIPNTQAQMLRQGAPTVIAVIIPSLREDVYLDLYTAIQSASQPFDYSVSVYTTDDVSNREEIILETLPTSVIAAVVTVSCISEKSATAYQALPCPVVYVDRKPPMLRPEDAFFSFDFARIGTELSAYILGSGWKHIAFFSSPNPAHQASVLPSILRNLISRQGIVLHEYTSDYNLALNKAFDIVQSGVEYDAIITSGSLRAESISAALQLSCTSQKPHLITLGTSRMFHANTMNTFELDYSHLGTQLALKLIDHLQRKQILPKETILQFKGFACRFDKINPMPGQVITMLTIDNPSTNALRKLLPLFEAVSGIQVNLVCVSYDDLHSQVEMLSPGFSYDLIRMDVARFDSLGEKIYMSLEEVGITKGIFPENSIHSGYEHYSILNGTLYALPFDPSVQQFLYRKDLFSDAKIKRSYYERYHEQLCVPQSMSQFLRIAEFFTQEFNPDSPTKYGATITNGSAATTASEFLPYFLEISNGKLSTDGAIQLNTPDMIQAMRQYQQLVPFACRNQWWSDSIRQFSEGMAATTITYSNHAASIIRSTYSNIVGKIGAAIIPGGNPLLGGGLIGISRYSRKVDACIQFFKWYYSPDVASLIVRLGGTSPLTDAYQDFRNFRIFPWLSNFESSFQLGRRGIGNEEIPGFSIQKYEFALGTAVKNLINGIIEPEEAAMMAQAIYSRN